MGNFASRFIRDIYKGTQGFLPAWPLGRPVNLGAIVDLHRYRMERIGSIEDPAIGITFEIETDPTPSTIKWTRKSDVSINFKMKGSNSLLGSNIPVNKAGISFSFNRNNAFYFYPQSIKYHRIKNLISIRNQILEKITRDSFKFRSIYVIKEVAFVSAYVLLISQSKDTNFEILADTGDQISITDLFKAEMEFKIVKESESIFYEISKKGGAIFFKAEKIRLRNDKREELKKGIDSEDDIRDSNLLAMVPEEDLSGNRLFDYMELAPLSLEDLENFSPDDEASLYT